VTSGTHDDDHDARLGRSVAQGIVFGLPVAYVLLVVALWLMLDQDFTKALETAALPGVLMGVFFGGFFGVARAMD